MYFFQTQLETLKAELRSAKVQIKDQFKRGEVLETKNNVSLLHVHEYEYSSHTLPYIVVNVCKSLKLSQMEIFASACLHFAVEW